MQKNPTHGTFQLGMEKNSLTEKSVWSLKIRQQSFIKQAKCWTHKSTNAELFKNAKYQPDELTAWYISLCPFTYLHLLATWIVPKNNPDWNRLPSCHSASKYRHAAKRAFSPSIMRGADGFPDLLGPDEWAHTHTRGSIVTPHWEVKDTKLWGRDPSTPVKQPCGSHRHTEGGRGDLHNRCSLKLPQQKETPLSYDKPQEFSFFLDTTWKNKGCPITDHSTTVRKTKVKAFLRMQC